MAGESAGSRRSGLEDSLIVWALFVAAPGAADAFVGRLRQSLTHLEVRSLLAHRPPSPRPPAAPILSSMEARRCRVSRAATRSRRSRPRAAARAAGAARRRRADRGRADRARVGLRDARPVGGRPRVGCARPPRRADRARPGDRARAGRGQGHRRGQGRAAGRRLRARASPARRLAGRALDDPRAARHRRPADPPDGPPRARGAAGRDARHQEPRPARRDGLPGQRVVVAGQGGGALPRRGPAQRGRRDPRPQPPVGRPDARRPTTCT